MRRPCLAVFSSISLFLCVTVGSVAAPSQGKTDEEKVYERAVSAYLAGELDEAATMLRAWLAEHPEDESAQRILDQVDKEQAAAKDKKTDLQSDISYLRQERLRLQKEMEELKRMIDEASGSLPEEERPRGKERRGGGEQRSADAKKDERGGPSEVRAAEKPVSSSGLPSKWLQHTMNDLGDADQVEGRDSLSPPLGDQTIPGLEEELSTLAGSEDMEGKARLVRFSIHSAQDVSRVLRMELSEARPFELDWHEDGKGLMLTVSDAAGEKRTERLEDQYVKQVEVLPGEEKLGIDIQFHSELSVEVLGGDRVIELALR